LERRALNRVALQVRVGLPSVPDIPCLGVVSRFDRQKGIDLIRQALVRLSDVGWQAVILGTGDERLERSILKLEEGLADRVRVHIGYDSGLARQIYGGSDILLMPSRYEPCGLAQMIAMRYGCIPLVNAVGGLKDTVIDGETGFVIASASAPRLQAAVRRAFAELAAPDRWVKIQDDAMSKDFSWGSSAEKYADLYRKVLSHVAPR
jgi:starch synthase